MDRTTLLKSVLNALPMPALAVGRGERILHMNQNAAAMVGGDLSGRHYITVLRQPALLDAIEACLRDNQSRSARFLGRGGGQDITYDVSIAAMQGDNPIGVLLTFQDVSDIEGVGQMRRDFVANVSHELRTPLTALSGFIETLQGAARNDPAAQTHFLGMMTQEATRMNRLVHDLLSLSRVESEARVRPGGRCDITAVLRETIEIMDKSARDTGVEITYDGPPEPIWIAGDRDQLTMVFRNLVENGIKYGSGTVTVATRVTDHDPALRGAGVVVDVSDDGDGIDPHHLPRLTERFYRVDTHRSRELGGTGLGLAIVKHILGRHRGRLRISSVVGEGSTFSAILPLT
ncbi:MAG: ATP-binding protein [Pseudomonadota bacterium]